MWRQIAWGQALKQCQEIFARKAELLKAAGVGEICVALPQPPRFPRFGKFVIDPTTEDFSTFFDVFRWFSMVFDAFRGFSMVFEGFSASSRRSKEVPLPGMGVLGTLLF